MSVLSPKPPVCLHEPIIRQALEAAQRLSGSGSVYALKGEAWKPGSAVCDHHIPRSSPCRWCDLVALERAVALLPRGRFDSTDCYQAQSVVMQATINGLEERVADLLGAVRRAEDARDRALGIRPGEVL